MLECLLNVCQAPGSIPSMKKIYKLLELCRLIICDGKDSLEKSKLGFGVRLSVFHSWKEGCEVKEGVRRGIQLSEDDGIVFSFSDTWTFVLVLRRQEVHGICCAI